MKVMLEGRLSVTLCDYGSEWKQQCQWKKPPKTSVQGVLVACRLPNLCTAVVTAQALESHRNVNFDFAAYELLK